MPEKKCYLVCYTNNDDCDDTGEVFLSLTDAIERLDKKMAEIRKDYKPKTQEEFEHHVRSIFGNLEDYNESRNQRMLIELDNWSVIPYDLIEGGTDA